MGLKEHCIYLLEACTDKKTEELEVDEVPVPIGVIDLVIKLLKSQELKEPLEDVVFFVGKPSLDSIVYHVLCRRVTLDAMKKDSNIHFMLLKQFNGVMSQDKEGWTLDDQENANRKELEGK